MSDTNKALSNDGNYDAIRKRIEELRSRRNSEKDTNEKKIKELEREHAELCNKADEDMKNGNDESYLNVTEEIKKCQSLIDMKKARLREELNPVIDSKEYESMCTAIIKEHSDLEDKAAIEVTKAFAKWLDLANGIEKKRLEANELLHIVQVELYRDPNLLSRPESQWIYGYAKEIKTNYILNVVRAIGAYSYTQSIFERANSLGVDISEVSLNRLKSGPIWF